MGRRIQSDPDHVRAGMTCLGSAVAVVLALVVAAAVIRVAGWLPLLLLLALTVLPVWRLRRASRRLDVIFREPPGTGQQRPGPPLGSDDPPAA